jgi:hypothetical protein
MYNTIIKSVCYVSAIMSVVCFVGAFAIAFGGRR